MNWDDLRFLLAIRRHHSFARAARALGVDATTIGRKLGALERDLGTRLLRRVVDGHALTADAEVLVPLVEQIELNAIAIERRTRDKGERAAGTVRITAGDGLMNYVLVPALPRLRAANPELHIELIGDLQVLDIARREADVAVRLVRSSSAALVASRLEPVAYGIYAAETYLRSRRAPATITELREHDWLDYTQAGARIPALSWLRAQLAPSRQVMRATTTTTLLQACAAGLGLALILTRVADSDPRLVRLLPHAPIPPRDAWAVYHRDDRRSARVRAVVRWLKEAL
jgi:DNA-binding transcriptional LysR family regulator